MKVLVIFVGVVYLLAPIIAFMAGYKRGCRTSIKASLGSLGFTERSASRYQDAMRLLNAMVRGSDLDGPFAGNLLTTTTEREAARLVNEYRQEIGI